MVAKVRRTGPFGVLSGIQVPRGLEEVLVRICNLFPSPCLTVSSQETRGIKQNITVTNLDTPVLESMIDYVSKGLN